MVGSILLVLMFFVLYATKIIDYEHAVLGMLMTIVLAISALAVEKEKK